MTLYVLLAETQKRVEANEKTVFRFRVVEGVSAFVLVDLDAS